MVTDFRIGEVRRNHRRLKSPAVSVYDELRAFIRSGAVSPGARLPDERTLARAHAATRTQVRNALLVLQSEGIIERRVGSGTFLSDEAPGIIEKADAKVDVRGMRSHSFHQIVAGRLLFEPQVGGLAASNRTAGDIARLHGALGRLKTAARWVDFKEAIYELDLAMYRAAGNSFLTSIFEGVRQSRQQVGFDGEEHQSSVAELVRDFVHGEKGQIVKAIEDQDVQLAERLVREHLLRIASSANL